MDALCRELNCQPGDLLEYQPDGKNIVSKKREDKNEKNVCFFVVLAIMAILAVAFLTGCAAGANPAIHVADAARKKLTFLVRFVARHYFTGYFYYFAVFQKM